MIQKPAVSMQWRDTSRNTTITLYLVWIPGPFTMNQSSTSRRSYEDHTFRIPYDWTSGPEMDLMVTKLEALGMDTHYAYDVMRFAQALSICRKESPAKEGSHR